MSAVSTSSIAKTALAKASNVHSLEVAARPDRAAVEAAVRTIIRWTGENPDRDGLVETPARVVRALQESFSGYDQDPAAILQKPFDEIDGYDEMIVLRGVVIKASHHCMATRGVHKPDADLVTSRMLGSFRDDPQLHREFLAMTA
jgi:GTP cyclohydrolase I